MTGEPLDLADIEARDAAMPTGRDGELTPRSREHDRRLLLAEVKRLRAAEGRIRALAARHQRIAALQTNPERLVMVPAITVTEDILAALDPTSEDTP